jgi:hypothetical protein
MVRHESEFIAADVHELRQKIKERALTTSRIASILATSKAAVSFFRFMARQSKNKHLES